MKNIYQDNLDYLAHFCQVVRFNYFKIVMTTGVFDILHKGHIDYLYSAKQFNHEMLIVGVDSDKLVNEIKGKMRPIFTETERASILFAFCPVDLVYIADDWEQVIKTVKPDKYVISKSTVPMEEIRHIDLIKNLVNKIVVLDPMSNIHTTDIIEKIKQIAC